MRVRQRPSTELPSRRVPTPRSFCLPRMPANFTPRDANGVQQMVRLPFGYNLPATSNGRGPLGHVLSLHAGMSYEALVCDRLGQNDAPITLMQEEDPPRRRTQWRFGSGGELGHPDVFLAGAGALRSAANNILTLPRPISVSSRRRWARG